MKSIYTHYTEYNLWANRRMASVFEGLPEELTNKLIPNSFPSVKLTFLHIWDAEYLWLKRLQGVSLGQAPSKEFMGNTEAAIELLLATSTDFLQLVEAQAENFLEKTLHFKTLSFGESSAKAFEMIHHCMNHSTYHRGQLTMMARQLGLDKLPSTDLIYFLREKGQQIA